MPPTATELRARETAPAGEHPGVAAHQVVVRSVVRDRAARSVPKAGGPDVGRHAAAAACDGEGIRVDGQHRTCAGSGCLDSKATGRPLELSSLNDPSPAAVAAAGCGRRGYAAPISNPTTTCASAPATTAARAFSISITT